MNATRSRTQHARHNPLRRRTDRLQWWAGLSLALLVLIGAPLAGAACGVAYYHRRLDSAPPAASWHPVTARLVVPVPGSGAFGPPLVKAPVRWTEAGGAVRTAAVKVAARSRAGAAVEVWTDAAGHATSTPPRTAAQDAAAGWAAGLFAGAGAAWCGWFAWFALRCALDRRRYARWEAEWAAVEPLISGRA
jgi:hypothetical protein